MEDELERYERGPKIRTYVAVIFPAVVVLFLAVTDRYTGKLLLHPVLDLILGWMALATICIAVMYLAGWYIYRKLNELNGTSETKN